MTEKSGVIVLHLYIQGRVQGVFFRRWVVDEATRRGLGGWVRNRGDGSVEAIFCGETGPVSAMAEACWRGPPRAQVENVVRTSGEYEPTDEDLSGSFRQLPTV